MLDMQGGYTVCPCKLFSLLTNVEEQAFSGAWDSDLNDVVPIPDHCVRVPQFLLSPCQVRVTGVGTEMGNRVIRKFTQEENLGPCSFIRLHVGDETGKNLFSDLSPTIQTHIKSTILNGIEVNGRKFEFLAYSSSRKYFLKSSDRRVGLLLTYHALSSFEQS